MSWVNEVRNLVPGYAKDTSLNLDNVINRSSLDEVTAKGVALASAFATGNMNLVNIIKPFLLEEDRQAALTAASLMAMNNVWYPYVEMTGDPALKGLPAQLRMNAYANHGGTTKVKFESYALAASIVGKCHFCVKSHYDTLQKEGLTVEQLRDIGRIAAVVTAVARAITA